MTILLIKSINFN